MTYSFRVGEPAPVQSVDPSAVPVGHAWAEIGPGGVQLLVKRLRPSPDERRAVEHGPVGLGIQDDDEASVVLLEVGAPAWPGYAATRVEIDPRAEWWGLDFELALCDEAGIVRAVRRFEGPCVQPTALWETTRRTNGHGAASDVLGHVAVFPAGRYGLVQPRGRVTVDTLVAARLELVALRGWEPGFAEVRDFRFAGGFEFSPHELERLGALEVHTRRELAGSRTLIITADRKLLDWSVRGYARLVRLVAGRTVLPYATAEEVALDLGIGVIPVLGGRPVSGPAPASARATPRRRPEAR